MLPVMPDAWQHGVIVRLIHVVNYPIPHQHSRVLQAHPSLYSLDHQKQPLTKTMLDLYLTYPTSLKPNQHELGHYPALSLGQSNLMHHAYYLRQHVIIGLMLSVQNQHFLALIRLITGFESDHCLNALDETANNEIKSSLATFEDQWLRE